MNKTIYLQILVLALPLLFSTLYAQETESKENSLITDQDKFITLIQGDALSAPSNTIENQSAANLRNTVFIKQIGADNVVVSNTVADYSIIKITQDGDQNKIRIDESAKEIEKTISQTGSNNEVIDFSFNQDISTKLELIQEGNNLIFERFGTNELSKNLKFKMSGESRTIIIRSF